MVLIIKSHQPTTLVVLMHNLLYPTETTDTPSKCERPRTALCTLVPTRRTQLVLRIERPRWREEDKKKKEKK